MDTLDLHQILQKGRAERFTSSDQLTLGDLIALLEPIADREKIKEDQATVEFDFEYAIPTGLSSWRGSYAELAIEFAFVGYQPWENTGVKGPNVSQFLDMLKNADGRTYEGWKGGDFVMSKKTPLWVANPGNSGNTGVFGIIDKGYVVYIQTGYCEY